MEEQNENEEVASSEKSTAPNLPSELQPCDIRGTFPFIAKVLDREDLSLENFALFIKELEAYSEYNKKLKQNFLKYVTIQKSNKEVAGPKLERKRIKPRPRPHCSRHKEPSSDNWSNISDDITFSDFDIEEILSDSHEDNEPLDKESMETDDQDNVNVKKDNSEHEEEIITTQEKQLDEVRLSCFEDEENEGNISEESDDYSEVNEPYHVADIQPESEISEREYSFSNSDMSKDEIEVDTDDMLDDSDASKSGTSQVEKDDDDDEERNAAYDNIKNYAPKAMNDYEQIPSTSKEVIVGDQGEQSMSETDNEVERDENFDEGSSHDSSSEAGEIESPLRKSHSEKRESSIMRDDNDHETESDIAEFNRQRKRKKMFYADHKSIKRLKYHNQKEDGELESDSEIGSYEEMKLQNYNRRMQNDEAMEMYRRTNATSRMSKEIKFGIRDILNDNRQIRRPSAPPFIEEYSETSEEEDSFVTESSDDDNESNNPPENESPVVAGSDSEIDSSSKFYLPLKFLEFVRTHHREIEDKHINFLENEILLDGAFLQTDERYDEAYISEIKKGNKWLSEFDSDLDAEETLKVDNSKLFLGPLTQRLACGLIEEAKIPDFEKNDTSSEEISIAQRSFEDQYNFMDSIGVDPVLMEENIKFKLQQLGILSEDENEDESETNVVIPNDTESESKENKMLTLFDELRHAQSDLRRIIGQNFPFKVALLKLANDEQKRQETWKMMEDTNSKIMELLKNTSKSETLSPDEEKQANALLKARQILVNRSKVLETLKNDLSSLL